MQIFVFEESVSKEVAENINNIPVIHTTIGNFLEYYKDYTFNPDTDILVKGFIQSDKFLKFILKYFNTKKNFLSHVFYFESKDITSKVPYKFMVTDCVLNQYPDLPTRIKIADNAIEFERHFSEGHVGVNVNFLSHSGHFNIKNKTACEAKLLTEHYKDAYRVKATDFQLDAALDYDLQKAKNANSEDITVANIIVTNDINEGNSIMKAFLLSRLYNIYGYVLGADCKIVLNSRSNLSDNEGAIKALLNI